MKKILLVQISLTLFLHAQVQSDVKVKTQHFNSPAEFNRGIEHDKSLARLKISIYREEIDNDRMSVVFIDKQGNTLKTIQISRDIKQQRLRIDHDYKEAFINTPKLIHGITPEVIRGAEYFTTNVYDSIAKLKFTFKDDYFSLVRLNKKFYLTVISDMENIPGESYLVDETGQKVSKIENLTIPTVRYRNDNITIVADGVDEVFAFDISGNILWTKDFKEPTKAKMSISEDGKICMTTINQIYILDSNNGEIIKTIPVTRYNGGVIAEIGTDGHYIFWANFAKRTPRKRLRDCEFVFYDLESDQKIWEFLLGSRQNKGWFPEQIGIMSDENYFFAKFWNNELILLNNEGTLIFSKKIKEPMKFKNPQEDVRIYFVDNLLQIHDPKNNEVELIDLRAKNGE